MAIRRICLIPDCGKPRFGHGFCRTHYRDFTRFWVLARGAACSIDGCQKTHYARGWCAFHYSKWRHCGDPNADTITAPLEYLRDVVFKFGSEDCLAWPFTRTNVGYGQISIAGKRYVVSRYVCEAVHGAPPTPMHQAAHSCGNGHLGCVNPGHLSWKTPAENQNDRNAHGTDIRGEQHSNAKLTEQQVREIRALNNALTNTAIAKMFGVSLSVISKIQLGTAWAHVCEEGKV